MRPRTDLLSDLLAHGISSIGFRTVFDVGANVGQSAHRFSGMFPYAAVYSFEPVQSTFAELQCNIRNYPNVRAFQFAMGCLKGTTTINVGKESTLNSIIVEQEGDQQQEVAVITIDSFCQDYGINHIDLLKIDTEGYDFHALVGATEMLSNKQIGFVQVESVMVPEEEHKGRFIAAPRFVEWLAAFGYQSFGIYEQLPHTLNGKTVLLFNLVFAHPDALPQKG